MESPDVNALLQVWEGGAGQGSVGRGLLLLSAAGRGDSLTDLARRTIGERDSALLTLREQLFGQRIQCLTSCEACGESIEIDLRTNGIRADCGRPDSTYETEAGGIVVTFRLPNSEDLLAVEQVASGDAAEKQLLTRCVIAARALDSGAAIDAAALPTALVLAVDERMGELDAQAQVVLDMTCPACERRFSAPFDIVAFLWTELERWARAMLREVHLLATAYGWTEREVLALSPTRRQAYLEWIGA